VKTGLVQRFRAPKLCGGKIAFNFSVNSTNTSFVLRRARPLVFISIGVDLLFFAESILSSLQNRYAPSWADLLIRLISSDDIFARRP
jgi:hypothetical protein